MAATVDMQLCSRHLDVPRESLAVMLEAYVTVLIFTVIAVVCAAAKMFTDLSNIALPTVGLLASRY